nr:unnamed protein product [Callosobruchus chinensis]
MRTLANYGFKEYAVLAIRVRRSTKIAYKFTKPRILGTLFVPPSSTRVTSNPFRSAVMFSAQRTGRQSVNPLEADNLCFNFFLEWSSEALCFSPKTFFFTIFPVDSSFSVNISLYGVGVKTSDFLEFFRLICACLALENGIILDGLTLVELISSISETDILFKLDREGEFSFLPKIPQQVTFAFVNPCLGFL